MATAAGFRVAADTITPATPSARPADDLASCGKRIVDKPGRTRHYHGPPLAARTYGPPRRIRVENGLALFLVLRVPGSAINPAQREAALTRSYFTKSIANKPL